MNSALLAQAQALWERTQPEVFSFTHTLPVSHSLPNRHAQLKRRGRGGEGWGGVGGGSQSITHHGPVNVLQRHRTSSAPHWIAGWPSLEVCVCEPSGWTWNKHHPVCYTSGCFLWFFFSPLCLCIAHSFLSKPIIYPILSPLHFCLCLSSVALVTRAIVTTNSGIDNTASVLQSCKIYHILSPHWQI